jgi:hypothetical protein
MSHHYSGPDFGFPHGDARLDLTDLYAFPKPSPSKRRWSEAAPMRAENDRQISVHTAQSRPRSGRGVSRSEIKRTRTRIRVAPSTNKSGVQTMNRTERTFMTEQIRLERRLPSYWRVTFDIPPLNIFGPKAIPQLNEIITAMETDQHVTVVVFDSPVDGFFLTHYDFLAPLEDSTSIPPGRTGLQALPDMLARLSRAPVVSIASIRGRATGVGSELALASDMRFASREKAILSQWEVGAGLVRVAARWRDCRA